MAVGFHRATAIMRQIGDTQTFTTAEVVAETWTTLGSPITVTTNARVEIRLAMSGLAAPEHYFFRLLVDDVPAYSGAFESDFDNAFQPEVAAFLLTIPAGIVLAGEVVQLQTFTMTGGLATGSWRLFDTGTGG